MTNTNIVKSPLKQKWKGCELTQATTNKRIIYNLIFRLFWPIHTDIPFRLGLHRQTFGIAAKVFNAQDAFPAVKLTAPKH